MKLIKLLKEQFIRELKAWVLSIGKINFKTGKTMYGWSIYDSPNAWVFLNDESNLLWAAREDDFHIGDKVLMLHNDTNRKLKKCKIIDKCRCNQESIIEMLYKHEYDYTLKKPFQSRHFNRRLQVSYSVKGIDYAN